MMRLIVTFQNFANVFKKDAMVQFIYYGTVQNSNSHIYYVFILCVCHYKGLIIL